MTNKLTVGERTQTHT